MATLSIQQIGRSGLKPSYSGAASGGDQFAHDADAFLHVKNDSGSSIDVTVASQVSNAGQGLTSDDLVVSVPNGEERLIGPFSDQAFADSNGHAQISYSATSSISVGVFNQR